MHYFNTPMMSVSHSSDKSMEYIMLYVYYRMSLLYSITDIVYIINDVFS